MRSEEPKILFIDDDDDYLFVMEEYLSRQGFNVLTASDGEAGLDLIRSQQPDVILLDFIMESLYSGLEVCRQVRNDPSLNRTPIICISGMKKDINLHFSKEEDAAYFDPDAYFDKPVDKEVLVKTINELVN